MKKIHIVMLVFIAAAIAVLIIYMGSVTTYETIASARQKAGKTVSVITTLDTTSIQYDPAHNPNFLAFEVTDTLGERMKVSYYFEKPYDMEKSERIVLTGKMENGVFQIREKKGILVKCPSKYKDDMDVAKKNLETASK